MKPVAHQRLHPSGQWMFVPEEDIEFYRNEGQQIRALGVIDPNRQIANKMIANHLSRGIRSKEIIKAAIKGLIGNE